MNLLQIVITGVVEGITEFLPVSSTGHLILSDFWLRIPATEFVKSFNIAIQLGAILAVVILYAKRLLVNRRLLARVLVGFIPTAIIGLALYKLVKTYLLGNMIVVLWSLFLGGIVVLLVEWRLPKRQNFGSKNLEGMTYGEAALVGLAQAVAIIPGVSRSAATIIGGLLAGFSREAIVEFSFLLAIPTMLAATGLDLVKSGANFSVEEWGQLAIGFLVSFLVALGVIKWFLRFIQKHDFKAFGVYRIVLAVVVWLLFTR